MGLLEKLEAKRREIDQHTRAAIGDPDYLWWCDLRELFDQLIAPPRMIVPPGFNFEVDIHGPAHICFERIE